MIGAWRTKLECSVWPSGVVVGAVLREDASRVPFAEDQDAVGEFGSGGPDEAFGEVVRSRAARWDLDGVDPGAGKGGVEGQFRVKPGSAQGFTRTNGDSSVGYPLVPGACGASVPALVAGVPLTDRSPTLVQMVCHEQSQRDRRRQRRRLRSPGGGGDAITSSPVGLAGASARRASFSAKRDLSRWSHHRVTATSTTMRPRIAGKKISDGHCLMNTSSTGWPPFTPRPIWPPSFRWRPRLSGGVDVLILPGGIDCCGDPVQRVAQARPAVPQPRSSDPI